MFGIEKVKINRNAWHFRWLEFLHFIRVEQVTQVLYEGGIVRYSTRDVVRGPQSICPYFWMLMGSFVATLIGVVGGTLVAFLVLGIVLFFIVEIYVWVSQNPNIALQILSLFAVADILMLISIQLLKYNEKRPKRYQEPKPRREPKTGLFYVVKTFLKARKAKVCPLVEYVV